MQVKLRLTIREPEHRGLIRALLRPINTAAIIILGTYTVVWGLWLASPWWGVLDRAPLYNEMKSFLPEWLWGVIAITCGLVTVYGAYRPSYTALITGSAVAFTHWLMISIFYFWGDWRNTGGITSLTFAIYAAFIYLNIRVNYRAGVKLDDIVP